MGEHGQRVRVPLARVTTDEGATGFGWSRVTRDQAAEWVGSSLDGVFDPANGIAKTCRTRDWVHALEYPLWDLAGRLAGRPPVQLLTIQIKTDKPEN